MPRIALVGNYNPSSETHVATTHAMAHSADSLRLSVETEWVPTEILSDSLVDTFDAVLLGTGVFEDSDKAISALKHLRKCLKPTLATCSGFQHMIIEYLRNVLQVANASHAEFDPEGTNHVITPFECSLRGRSLDISIINDSKVHQIYGSDNAQETYCCNFGVNPDCVPVIEESPLRIVGSDDEGAVRITELPEHPFYIGTLFVPQIQSKPGTPHPLVSSFVAAACRDET